MDLIGQKFNRLLVIGNAERYISPSGHRMKRWLCRCDCGKKIAVTTNHLISGHTKSCGCYAKEVSIQNGLKKKHGLTKTRIHRICTQMKTRCFNPKDEHYKDYGGRGITICDGWKDNFQAFYDWALSNGYEEHLTIDRIDVNGNYEPSNCRWATQKEQSNNKRTTPFITFNGVTKTLLEWSDITGIKYQTLFYRYKAGKTPVEILKK